MVCQESKCPDYDTSDGEPAWCNRAGFPAIVVVKKCLKDTGDQKQEGKKNDVKRKVG